MALTEKDLNAIKDLVEFTVEKSEMRLKDEFGSEFKEIKSDIKEIKRNLDDLIETNQNFLEIFGSHETRITKLETQTVSQNS